MNEVLLLGLGFLLINRLGKSKSNTISNDDYTPTTGSRTGSGDATDSNFDYVTSLQEVASDPWTWKQRPAIFKEVPISPGSRNRWLQLGRLWKSVKDNELDLYQALRDAAQDDQERGGTTDTKAIIKQFRAKGYAIQSEIRRLVNVQRKTEARYKDFLVNNVGPATVQGYYAQRKKEITDGIWPYQETTVVPETIKPDSVTPGNDQINVGPGLGDAKQSHRKKRAQGKMVRTPNTVDFDADEKREALPPGRRVTDGGGVYYEYRTNRSDYKGPI